MPQLAKDLWSLVQGRPQVDPHDLAAAVEHQAGEPAPDYRTRLLIRDSVEALVRRWGRDKVAEWLAGSPVRLRIEAICREAFEEPGFPSLAERVMDKTDPDDVRQFLRDLGTRLDRPVRVDVGGSVALILRGYLSRHTEDIDVVDEVPPELRTRHELLRDLEKRYGLKLTHFQSHYLPGGWAERVRFLDSFGQLRVHLVDAADVFLSKLFSGRSKDLDDLRALAPQLDKETLARRVRDTAAPLLAEAALRQRAEQNWYILYGEALPT
jgi:hypothetical protein